MNGSPRRAYHRRQQRLAPVVGATSILALIGLGLAWAAYMRRYVLHDLPMTAALSGELRTFASSAGRLAYYTAGSTRRSSPVQPSHPAPALLFLHSINAAASSYEMKPLYEHYARERKVYALDLPGFGFSERRDRPYTPQLYCDAINEFLSKELKGSAVDAVALSLSSEFLALAAVAKPEYFHSLTFISPTGMSVRDMTVRTQDAWLSFLLHPAWNRLIFDTLTSRLSIRYYTQLSQARPAHRGFTHYAYVTSHQPNAQVAPFYFLAGKLFTPGVFVVYQKLTQPILMMYGQSRTTRYDMVDVLRTKSNWRVEPFTRCGDLIQFDDPKGVIAQMDQFYRSAPQG